MRMLTVLLAATRALAGAALAAQSASPYLPVDHWAMPYVEYLIRAGVIADPSPLTRPLRLGDVVAALRQADTTASPPAVRATIRRLAEALTPRGAPPYYCADLYVSAAGGTQARRDELHLAGPSWASLRGGARLSAAFGPVAVSAHPYTDRYLRVDPDYTGDKTKSPPGRITDAYISVQAKYGEAFFGALRRNWGPTGIDGFLTSSYAYSYDHLMASVGTSAVRVEALATQLDDMTDSTGTTIKRYWSSTRVIVHPWKWLTASLDNAALWYGPNRGFEPRFLNPLKLAFITSVDDKLPDNQNTIIAGAFWVALPRRATLQGSVLIDAISSGFLSGGCCDPFPSRLGATGVVDVPVASGVAARAWATVVTAFAYRAPSGLKNSVMLRGIGLGRNFADYVEAGASTSLVPWPMVTVSPRLVFLKQGQGDFRLATPPLPVRGPVLFEGIVERTWRLGVVAQAQFLQRVDVGLDAGWNVIDNSGHQPGNSFTKFVGAARATVRFGGPVHLP